MEREEFEKVSQEIFDSLPAKFKERIENVHIVVEDVPTPDILRRANARPNAQLLGLYEGIPLNRRGEHYGMYPVVPDTITLFKIPIEAEARSEANLREKIREVLIHEIAHYFGMSEREVRAAGY